MINFFKNLFSWFFKPQAPIVQIPKDETATTLPNAEDKKQNRMVAAYDIAIIEMIKGIKEW